MKTRSPKPKMLAPCECANLKDIGNLQANECRVGEMMADTAGDTVRIGNVGNGLAIVLLREELDGIIRWWKKKQKVRK
jgi:hypothetical protein